MAPMPRPPQEQNLGAAEMKKKVSFRAGLQRDALGELRDKGGRCPGVGAALAQLPQFRGRFPGFPGTYGPELALHFDHM